MPAPVRALSVGMFSTSLQRHLSSAVLVCYLLALLVPGPGARLRASELAVLGLRVNTASGLLFVLLLAASFQVPIKAAAVSVRRPKILVVGLAAHLATAFVLVPVSVLVTALPGLGDSFGCLPCAAALIGAAPVAAAATVWMQRSGDVSMVLAVVLLSALLSPLTMPATLSVLGDLLPSGARTQSLVEGSSQQARTLLTVAVAAPCVCGLLLRRVAPPFAVARLAPGAPGVAMGSMLLLTYLNATAAVPLLRREGWAVLLACGAVGWGLCRLAFGAGMLAARVLRLSAPAAMSVTLVCGMSNVSVSAVIAVQTLPEEPRVLLVALVYGFVQKLAAQRAVSRSGRMPDSSCESGREEAGHSESDAVRVGGRESEAAESSPDRDE